MLGEAGCIKSLGEISLRRNDYDTARALFEQARSPYQRIGSALGEANCIYSLGRISLRGNDRDTARALLEQARSLYRRISSVLGEANCIKSLGDIALLAVGPVQRGQERLPAD